MNEKWSDRSAGWERFAQWERERLAELPSDFRAALAWMSDAWELAARVDPDWQSPAAAERHWKELAEVRDALSRWRPRT